MNCSRHKEYTGEFPPRVDNINCEKCWEMYREKHPDPGHKDKDCPRIAIFMECPECRYPLSEANQTLPYSMKVWRKMWQGELKQ